jgi:hypothetical protein
MKTLNNIFDFAFEAIAEDYGFGKLSMEFS